MQTRWKTPDLLNWICFSLACTPLPRAGLHPRLAACLGFPFSQKGAPSWLLAGQAGTTHWLAKVKSPETVMSSLSAGYILLLMGSFCAMSCWCCWQGHPLTAVLTRLEKRQHKWAKARQHRLCWLPAPRAQDPWPVLVTMWPAALLYFRILSEWQLWSFTFKKVQAPGRVVLRLAWWPVLELQGVRAIIKPAWELATSPKKILRVGCPLSMSISGRSIGSHFSLKNVQVFTVPWRLML